MSRPFVSAPILPRAALSPRRLAGLAMTVIAAVALSGCISLLPKAKPAQLYRFGYSGGAAQGEAASSAPRTGGASGGFGVLKPPAIFQREAAGDRILTVDGSEVAYIGEARWVAPAQILFDEAVAGAFAADPGPARLLSRGDPRRIDYTLRLAVRSFEVRYAHGRKAAPEVVLIVDASLARNDRSLAGERTFEVVTPARENRVGAIVDAFNGGLDKLLPDLTRWVDAAGPPKD